MRKFFTCLFLGYAFISCAQTPLYYQSNYLRVVQPNDNQKLDTLVNPYTGGMNNPMFFNIDYNGDGIQDLFVFDREVDENQFLNFTAVKKNSTEYHFTPRYESAFPNNLYFWAELADFNRDGKADIFTHSHNSSTGISVYKNTSYIDPVTKKYTLQFSPFQDILYSYNENNEQKEIAVPQVSNPIFMDVDKDGYTDIVSFDINLYTMQYYRNRGKGTDSLSFYYTDRCWGKFTESGSHFYTPINCTEFSTYDPKQHKRTEHGYSAIGLVDADGDGDYDMLVGDGGNDSLAILINGKSKNKNNRDTIVNIAYVPKSNSYPVDLAAVIHTMPDPSLLDVDNDGIKDLIVAAGQPTDTETYHSSRLNNIWYYRNFGDTVTPVFRFMAGDFLQNTTVDWGVNSAPCFIDVDRDGRPDLLLAVRDGGEKHGFSHIILYLNKPGKNGGRPYLLYQAGDYMGLASLAAPIVRPVPASYKNGKDSSTDLIMGNDSGHVMYFKDRGRGKKAADFQLAQSSLLYMGKNGLTPIDVGANSSPTSVDVNGDGMTDLLLGANDGHISYYRCLGYGPGPDHVPYFQLVNSTFGNINKVQGTDFQSAPCAADLNGNGKPDLLIGDRYGRLMYYPDFDTTGTLVPVSDPLVYDYRTSQRCTGKLFSTWVIPAVAKLDQDTIPDIMLGCRRGGLFFLGSQNNGFETLRNTGIAESRPVPTVNITAYPNPAKDYFTIKYNSASPAAAAELKLTDMMGRVLLRKTFRMETGTGELKNDISQLPGGVYTISITAENQLTASGKIIIYR